MEARIIFKWRAQDGFNFLLKNGRFRFININEKIALKFNKNDKIYIEFAKFSKKIFKLNKI